MSKLKIGIAGTRGVPNRYGGFEQVAGYLAAGLAARGHEVTVYNSHNHTYQEPAWCGANIVHCYDPEHLLGTAGQFIYDYNCIADARKRHFDVLLLMGYTSSSVWGKLYPSRTAVITNMDGLEWKRTKYSARVRRFLRYAEKLAVKYSDALIADSIAIQQYLEQEYRVASSYIPYGAEVFTDGQKLLSGAFELKPGGYFMLMARMEPENNIETILDGFHQVATNKQFVVVGNTSNAFGSYLRDKFAGDRRIRFIGPVFNNCTVQALQQHAALYFHGHSVGGTNPSLLEAMAAGALIAAHNNPFNRAVLQRDAFYFSSVQDIARLIADTEHTGIEYEMIANNSAKITSEFNWNLITDSYEELCYRTYEKLIDEKVFS